MMKREKMNKKRTRMWLWICSIIFLITGFGNFPGVGSFFFLLVGLGTLPINKWQEFIASKIPEKLLKFKTLILILAVILGTMLMPTTEVEQDINTSVDSNRQVAEVTAESTEEVASISAPQKTPEAPQNPAKTHETLSEKSAGTTNPSPIPTQESTPEIVQNSYFEVHYIDVGQADAALICCDDQYLLIDGGNADDSSLMYSYLKNLDVEYLDYVVATHAHEDHVGGIAGALNFATAGTIFCPVTEHDTEAFNNFKKYVEKSGASITVPTVGDTFNVGSAKVQIVGVNGGSEENDTSIILRICYGETSFLFTGDSNRDAEQVALNSGYELESTVLKVGHHGGKNATEYVFLQKVAPQYAVISVGEDNTYGHPAEETLSRLRDADVTTYRTDLQGTIICVSDGSEVDFAVSKNEDADTLAPTATIEQLQDVVRKSVDKYNGSSDKKLVGKLTYNVISKTDVQLIYDASQSLSADEETLADEAAEQILTFVLADISASDYAKADEVYVEVTVNYDISEEEPTRAPTSTADPEPEGTDYIGNINTKKFHYSWCNSVKQMKESNKYYYTGTRDGMISKGYVPCKNCNP